MGFGWIIALLWGGLSFGSVYLIQMPLQKWLGGILMGTDIEVWLRSLIIVGPSGIIQEFSKALLPILLIVLGARIGTSKNLFGPFAGVGFALTEAVILVGLHPADIGWIAIVERASAIIFHVGLCSIAVGGGKGRRIAWGLPLAMLLHGLCNYAAVFLLRPFGVNTIEIVIGAIALATWALSLILYMGEKNA